jgi:hypothetical protein
VGRESPCRELSQLRRVCRQSAKTQNGYLALKKMPIHGLDHSRRRTFINVSNGDFSSGFKHRRLALYICVTVVLVQKD